MKQADIVRILLSERERLLAYINAIVCSHSLAEDVFQETAVLLMKKQDKLTSDQHVRGWLRLTARHLAMKSVKQRSRQAISLDVALIEAMDASWDRIDNEQMQERLELLTGCIEKLTSYSREILKLRYAKGMTGDRLAEKMGRNTSAVQRAMTRIHRQLAECVQHKIENDAKGGVAR